MSVALQARPCSRCRWPTVAVRAGSLEPLCVTCGGMVGAEATPEPSRTRRRGGRLLR